MNDDNAIIDFEKSLTELNDIVTKMEQGGLSLEESLRQFEKGITLTRQCQQALNEAAQKVQLLIEKNGDNALTDYTEEN